MSYDAGGPHARRQAAQARRRPRRAQWWVFGALLLIVLLAVAGNGSRSWWAGRLGDITHGSRGADFVVGLAVGLLPLLAIAVAGLRRTRRRALRMFVAGAVGFVVTDLLAPSLATAIRHTGGAATRPFETRVPGYLPGVYTGIVLELVLLVVAVVRLRSAVHRHVSRYGS